MTVSKYKGWIGTRPGVSWKMSEVVMGWGSLKGLLVIGNLGLKPKLIDAS